MDRLKYVAWLTLVIIISVSCQKEVAETASIKKFLYVTSGMCYSGVGITTFSSANASNQIFKIDTGTGIRENIIADYYASYATAGDTPISAIDWTADNLLVLVRNGNSAKLELLLKKGGTRNSFGTSPAMSSFVNSSTQAMIKNSEGSILFSRAGNIEKINASGVKNAMTLVTSNLGSSCGTVNALYTTITTSKTGRIIFANGASSPNNRVISVPATGAIGTCDTGLAAPAPTAVATAMVFDHANGKLIVAYSGPTVATSVNSIHAYDFNEATGAITNDRVIYDASLYPATHNYLLFGISAMALDADEQHLYVSTAISTSTSVTNYAIERLKYDGSKIGSDDAKVLLRNGNLPFYNYGVDTRCISSMTVSKDAE